MPVMRLIAALMLCAAPAFAQSLPTPQFGGVINVKATPYNAKGNGRSVASCSITAASTALTCVASSFSAADVGKWIVVRTAGASGASHVTTIASYTSATAVGLTVAAVSTASAARIFYGTDDTAAFTSAVAAASAAGTCVYLPTGSYGLYSATTSIVLQNTCLTGDPMVSDRAPYVDKGTNILIFNASTATFKQGFNASYSNLGFFWPVQDGSQTTPIVYPALISAPDATYRGARMGMSNITFVNPYIVFQTETANTGTGAWTVSDVRSYCILTCINFLGGSTAYIAISQWINSPTTYATEATGGNAYLGKWTANNGSMFTVDTGADNVTGFSCANCQAYGVASAINLKSGRAAAWLLTNYIVDGAASYMVTSGAAIWESSTITGGYIYCQQPYDTTVSAACFDLNSTGNSINLRLNGVTLANAAGSFIYDRSSTSAGTISVTNSRIENFGQSTTTAQYWALNIANSSSQVLFENNQVFCNAGVGSTAWGVRYSAILEASVVSNQFKSCQQAFVGNMASGSRWEIAKNVSRLTVSTPSMTISNPTQTGAFVRDDNNWDKVFASTITSGFGTSPTISCPQNGLSCRITIGTAPGGSGIMAFPWTRGAIPSCTATSSAAVALGVVATTTNVTISGSFTAADVISVTCAGS